MVIAASMLVRQASWAPLSARRTPMEAAVSICRFRNRHDRSIIRDTLKISVTPDGPVVFILADIADF
jgi:hypothetical protein